MHILSLCDRLNLPAQGLASHKGHDIALLALDTRTTESVLLGCVPVLAHELDLAHPLLVLDFVEGAAEITGEALEAVQGAKGLEDGGEVREHQRGGEDAGTRVGTLLPVRGVGG